MAVSTALSMAIDGEDTVRLATIDNTIELHPYVASGSSSGTGRKCGVKDWRSVGLGYGAQPGVFPGDTFTLTLSLDGTYGYTGSAYCEQIDIIVDVENNKYIENAVHASRNGALTVGAAATSDTAVPNPPCSESLTVQLDGVDQDDVRYMHLMIRCPGKPYVSSSTAAGRQRKRGAIDAQLVYRVYNINPALLPVVGSNYVVDVETSASATWELTWMRCESVKHLADHESDEAVSAEVTMSFNASNGTTLGTIKDTAGVTQWPF
jgi:hypothetical protein